MAHGGQILESAWDKMEPTIQYEMTQHHKYQYYPPPLLTSSHYSHFLTSIYYPTHSTQVYETPFFVAVDHDKKKVVISIRGTLSLKVSLGVLTLFSMKVMFSLLNTIRTPSPPDTEGKHDHFLDKGNHLKNPCLS